MIWKNKGMTFVTRLDKKWLENKNKCVEMGFIYALIAQIANRIKNKKDLLQLIWQSTRKNISSVFQYCGRHFRQDST